MRDYKRDPVVQVRLASFASDHGLPQERFYNLLCLAFGANPVRFADLAQEGYLPPTRAPNCQHEYKVVADAFHKEITPHIDWELAKGGDGSKLASGPCAAICASIVVRAESLSDFLFALKGRSGATDQCSLRVQRVSSAISPYGCGDDFNCRPLQT